jgi:hypothetical protein
MKTIEINAYEYSELSDKAKLKALTDYQSDCEYDWSYDAIKSLGAFMTAVGVKMTNYDIDWLCPSRSKVRYEGNPHSESIKEELTGAFSDYPLTITWNKTKSIELAVQAFLGNICKDYEYQLSEEGFLEVCHNCDMWFDENGNQLLY